MAKAETAILDKAGVARAITRIAHEILEHNKGGEKLALVGIRTGGDHLATLLQTRINEIEGLEVPLGAVDITMYRDRSFWLMMFSIPVAPFVQRWML